MIIAGTGHRPNKLGGYTPDVRARCLTLATRWLGSIRPHTVISGMALGWDQALAQAAIDLGIPFHAYIPFQGQEAMWPKESQKYFHELLKSAAAIKYTSPGGYAGWKMQKRNIKMVDDCTHVLALWDGSSGGTANCIVYAEIKHRPIINLWEHWIGIR